MTDLIHRILQTRAASNVERCHTIPHGGRSYSDGKHVAGALKLLYLLWPEDFSRLAAVLLFHDDGEFVVGDIPGPTFWAFPDVKRAVDDREKAVLRALRLPTGEELGEEDAAKLLFCDKVESAFWALEEIREGNRAVLGPLGRSVASLRKQTFPEPADGVMVWLEGAFDYIARVGYQSIDNILPDGASDLLEVIKNG